MEKIHIHQQRVPLSFPCLVLLICLLQIFQIDCSNLETRLPMVKEGPDGSLFGLSIAEHTMTSQRPSSSNNFADSLILVGAPKYQSPDALVPLTGGVFRCPLSTFIDDCEDLGLDNTDNEDAENKTNQWLGVTVRSQGPGGHVAACAHRYKVVSSEEISGLGKCYLRNADLTEIDVLPESWKMCKNIGLGKSKYGYCQAGTGFYISEEMDNERGKFISGTPGAGDWRGGIFTTTTPDDSNVYFDSRHTKLADESTGVGLNSYLGFAVTSGRFSKNESLIASGAPRHNAIGAVVIIGKDATAVGLVHRYILPGEQLTESFGYEVCSADLDGDGFDDLIVGAPIYYDREAEAGGRVYVYLNKYQNGTFLGVEPIRLTGPRDSMFGIAITNLGDLNLDGYEDIAVGAPYENDGVGAVYIYMGGPNGLVLPESQKITPADLPQDLPTTRDIGRAFGYSLSGGIDLDGNQYPDLSVGAFESDSVITFRARPIINITAELILENNQLDDNVTNFVYEGEPTFRFYVQVHMKYTCEADLFDAPIKVKFSIEAEQERRDIGRTSRIIFEKSRSYAVLDESIRLKAQSEEMAKRSEKFWVVLRPGFKDIFRKIPFKLTYWLPDVDVTTPAPGDDLPDIDELIILNSLHDPSYLAEVDFIKACAQDDNECITDLDIEAYLDLSKPILRVGEHKDLLMQVVLRNREEPAYDARLVITFPEMLRFNKIEDDASQLIRHGCNELTDNTTVIVCELGNPFPELEVERFTVKFDTSEVPSDAGNFTIRLIATAANRDLNPEDNDVSLFAEVESITDLQIIGQLNAPQYTFGGELRGESTMNYTDEIGDEVIHTWTVYNKGPGIVPESVVTFSFPYEVANGKWLLYMTHAPVVEGNRGLCEIDPMYVNELNIQERPETPTYSLDGTPVSPSSDDQTLNPTDTTSTIVGSRRRRREARLEAEEGDASRSERSSTKQALAGQTPLLNCWSKTARCFEFKCFMDRLEEEDEVKIYVKSRLWNSTFLEDYINAVEVNVTSVAKIEILNAPFLTQYNEDNDAFNLTMRVRPSIVTLPPPEPLAWWIILLAVLGGLIILILLILLLWKCGFFERKSMAYKYATVTQKTAGGNAATEKTAYYDEKYFN